MREILPINPKILIWARESANLEVEEVAHRMKKAAGDIEAWEEGSNSPTYIQLEKLAYSVYKRPIALFFFPEPPEELSPDKSFRTLPENEIENLSPSFLKVFRRAIVRQLNLQELLEGSNPSYQEFRSAIRVRIDSRIEQVAKRLRDYLAIPLAEQFMWKSVDVAFEEWRTALERNGIYVFKDAFKDDLISGFCLYDTTFPIIYVNNSMPKSRQIFTLFHELAHILFKTGGVDKNDDSFIKRAKGDAKHIEVICNKFAGVFLVPQSGFDKDVASLKIDESSISILSDKYSVSREVILRKLLDKNLISHAYYEQAAKKYTKQAKKSRAKSDGGNYYYTEAAYLGLGYIKLAFQKYYQQKISDGQLADYLGVKVKSISGIEESLYR